MTSVLPDLALKRRCLQRAPCCSLLPASSRAVISHDPHENEHSVLSNAHEKWGVRICRENRLDSYELEVWRILWSYSEIEFAALSYEAGF